MPILILILMFFTTLPSYSEGDLHITKFLWKADNDVEIHLTSGRDKLKLSGQLRDGESVSLTEDGIELTVHAYSSSFVSLTATQEGEKEGRAMFLERLNGRYNGLSPSVAGPAETLKDDLHMAVTTLEQTNGWDHSIAIRSILSYFGRNPKKMIGDFLTEVNAGQISTIAKPQGRRTGKWETKAIRGNQGPVGAFATREDKIKPQPPAEKKTVAAADENESEPKPRPRKNKTKKPYEPRFRPRPNPGFFGLFFGN